LQQLSRCNGLIPQNFIPQSCLQNGKMALAVTLADEALCS
jgi:hypothetical protein